MQDDSTTTLAEVIGRLEQSGMNGPVERELHRRLEEKFVAGCRAYRPQGVLCIDTSEVFLEVAKQVPDPGKLAVGRRARLLQVAARAIRTAMVDCASRYLDDVASRPPESRDPRSSSHERAGMVTFDVDRAHGMLAVNAALGIIEEDDERLARIVECELFGRMNTGEAASALGLDRSLMRRERLAAWARLRELVEAEGGVGGQHDPG